MLERAEGPSADSSLYDDQAMISIVMPAHNEEGYLESAVTSVVIGLPESGGDFEARDIGETGPRTAPSMSPKLSPHHFRKLSVIQSAAADYGLALKRGFLAAKGDIVANFDVDMVDLGFLDRALELMRDTDVAIVIGSKRGQGADDQRNLARKAISTVFSASPAPRIRLEGQRHTHGLKAMRRAPLVQVVNQCRFGEDIFDTELVLRAERSGMVLGEVPVVVSEVRPPRTPIARRIPRTLVGLVRLRVTLR